ncbi:MAG: sensor domain-containing protein, partial [Mycobacterium sp.]
MRIGLARAVALLSIGLLATACTGLTGGKAQAPPNLGPQSLTGQTIKRALLGDETLSRILQQPFTIDDRFPPRFGGPEALQGLGSASPADCLGVAQMLHQSVYPSGTVNDVAVETWRHAVKSSNVTGVKEGVVSLPTASDANALFSRFAGQWRRCDGQAPVLPDGMLRLKATITNVQVTPSVLAGTVSIAFASSSPDTGGILAGRAVGVRGNCLVEVEVDFFNAPIGSPQGSGVTNAAAVDIAQAMMGRV